jgi:hypothetical protein
MYTIHINHPERLGGPRDYTIYTKREAIEASIDFKHWKEAENDGWVISDDDYVAEVIQIKEYDGSNGSHNKMIKMPYGYILYNVKYPNRTFNAIGRSTPHTYSGKPGIEVKSKQDKMKNLAMTYAQTMNKDLAIELAFPGGVNENARGRYKRIMRTETFGKMVREELQKVLSEHGMTEGYTLDLLAEAIAMAREKKDVTNILKAVDNLQTMHGMKETKKVKTTQQLEQITTRKLLDQIGEEKERLVATQITEKEDDR